MTIVIVSETVPAYSQALSPMLYSAGSGNPSHPAVNTTCYCQPLHVAFVLLLQHAASPASAVAVKVDLSLLDVSLVDARPAELLLTTLEGLRLEMRKGNSAGIPYEITSVRLNSIQVGGEGGRGRGV